MDAYGDVLNRYGSSARTAGPSPQSPWALHLAGADHRFRLLCFDLDAKTASAAAAAARDAEMIEAMLVDVGLEPVVCQSGPTGGRHVWVALAESVDAALVATLARFTHKLCPTLDMSPLLNPATGCVRPPGAPHRLGGHSTPIRGNASVLAVPTGTAQAVVALVERLAIIIGDEAHSPTVDTSRPLPVDKHARLYLPGQRRGLPAVTAAALDEDAALGDASAVMWRVLVGAASARWRHTDVAALVEHSPGLEHIRTIREGRRRVPRGRVDAKKLLCRWWDRAVRYVATHSDPTRNDPTFDARADDIASYVRAVQSRADTATGRWIRGGGPADRRVLDVLCVLALQAVNPSVEADTRRVALMAGIGRETARTALHRLCEDGWISHTHAASGPHGAHWFIGSFEAFHTGRDTARSQVDTRPRHAGPAERTLLLQSLTSRMTSAAHDAFTHSPGLGLLNGNIYAHTTTEPQTASELAHRLGTTEEDMRARLHQLSAHGLLVRDSDGWRRPDAVEARDSVASRLGVTGRLHERARRYALEREQWAWWLAEEAWMHAPRRTHITRRAGSNQFSLVPTEGTNSFGAYPRRPDGRADHFAATREIVESRGGSALRKTREGNAALVRQKQTSRDDVA